MSEIEQEQQRLQEAVSQILDEARKQGAVAAEAGANTQNGLSVTVRLGEVETVEHVRDKGIGVTVYFPDDGGEGLRKGNASTSDIAPDAIRETVKAACDIARYTEVENCAGLAPAALMATDIPDLDLYHPWAIEAETAIDLAKAAEDVARAEDARISNSEGATLSSYTSQRVYGNSHGFLAGYPSTRHSLSCVVIAKEGEQMQRDYWYDAARRASDLEAAEVIGKKAAERSLRRLNGRRLGTSQVPVLYSPECASSLLGHFIAAVRGGSLYRKSSFLVDSLGKQVFPEHIQLYERPHMPMALGSAAFDGDGVATQARDLVRDGVVEGYVLDHYSACRLGMTTTGNAGGVHNLIIEPGSRDAKQMLAEMGTGLLVTELIGQGINMVTGDYSRGAAGFWVENGEIQYPVEEITIAGNLKQMFTQLVAVGNDVDHRGNTHCGSLLIEQMTVAGE